MSQSGFHGDIKLVGQGLAMPNCSHLSLVALTLIKKEKKRPEHPKPVRPKFPPPPPPPPLSRSEWD